MLIIAKLGICHIQQELSKSKSNLFPLKSNNKSKSLFIRVAQVVNCQLFQKSSMKIKNIVSSRLLSREMAWFNLASQRFKDQIAPPTGNIYGI